MSCLSNISRIFRVLEHILSFILLFQFPDWQNGLHSCHTARDKEGKPEQVNKTFFFFFHGGVL